MAEAAMFGLAKSVLRVLASPVLDELKLLWGQKEQLERLEGTLTTIRDVLHDADRRQASNVAVQGWLTRLKIVLYEADDLFDMISAKLLQSKSARGGSRIGRRLGIFLSKPRDFAFVVKTAHKVKAIRKRLDYIARDIQGFGFLPIQTEQDEPRRRESHSYFPRAEVIGREKEREDLVKVLLDEQLPQQRGVPVVAVVGIGGLGKSTLAQLVYDDERVQQSFELRMWVCVNYFTHLNQVLVALIKSATRIDTKDLDLDQLQDGFRQIIRGKRFLLALDDVWDEDPHNWYRLKILLDFGGKGSRILATMRSVRVARSMCVTNLCCRLKGLSDESAWLLFKRIAFGEEQGQLYQGELEQIGQHIVKKCANVPLAVVTIAALLRGEEKETWIRVENDELSGGAPDGHSKIMQALKISYNRLPYPVKSCFAYCSLFPKQYRFEKAFLIRLWLAQGFLEPSNANRSLEDIAEEYFLCLVERCILQDMKRNSDGVYSWGMHDLVHDLAVEVARSDCVLASEKSLNCWDKNTRHVSFHNESESLVSSVCSFSDSKSSRTLLCLHTYFFKKNLFNKIFSSSKSLRVLRLSSWFVKNVPSSIGELIHLRYVDLSIPSMKKLPSSVCNLPHLQTLILERCYNLRGFPKDIGKLVSLRHLVFKDSERVRQMPPGLAALTSLVTLDKLVVHSRTGGLRYLELLDNLSGSLEIVLLPVTGWKNARADAERSFLSRKNKLCTLAIRWALECEVRDLFDQEDITMMMDALQPHPNMEHLSIHTFKGPKMPSWIMGLRNLVSLKLEACGGCTELLPLSRLSCLKELYISALPLVSIIEVNMVDYDPDLFFKSLETLSISRMPNLTSWWLQAPRVVPSFPRVTRVKIDQCPKMTASMPLFPLVLQSLVLSDVQEELIWHGIRSGAIGHTSYGNSVLRHLSLSQIRGLWSMSEAHIRHLSALQKLILHDQQQTSMSCVGLSYLTSLEVLRIESCPYVEWIDGDDKKPEVPWAYLSRLRTLDIPNISKSLFKGLMYLTCLEYLKIHEFGPLLQNVSDSEEEEEGMPWKSSVSDSEEEEEGMPWKSLEKLWHLIIQFGWTRSGHLLKGVQYLTCLRYLEISDCKELYLPWNALLGIKNLKELTFLFIDEVTAVEPTVVGQMPISTLQVLLIRRAPAQFVHDIPWKSFPTLHTLHLQSVSSLEALPEGIQHLAALEELHIDGARSLLSLPYWMSSLSSLTSLSIEDASDELRKRCKKRTRQDWPKIRHIGRISIPKGKDWFV